MADDEVSLTIPCSEVSFELPLTDPQGASPRELVVEACRRDQPHLIEQVLNSMNEKSNEEVAQFFNEVTDALGNHALHICALYGSCTCPSYRDEGEFADFDTQTT